MVRARLFDAIGLAVFLSTVGAGCVFGVQPGVAPDGDDTETVDISDAGEADGETQGCDPACEAYGQHSIAECVDGTCEYRCEEGWIDANEDYSAAEEPDPQGDGCERECETSNDGEEICDGEDNDCDGEIDESFDVGESCTAGTGACERSGERVCNDSGDGTNCGASPAEAGEAEICGNDVDDDCDGEVDEREEAEGFETFWLDCDGDGFAPEGAATREFCTTDSAEPSQPEVEKCNDAHSTGDWPARQWVSTNPDEAEADCNDTSSRAYPGFDEQSSLDEKWRCDGLDNDCAGGADTPCCSAQEGAESTVKTVDPNEENQSAYALVGAHDGGPEGAAFLLIWGEGRTLYTQHLDPRAGAVGDGDSESLDFQIQDVSGTRTTDGYEYMVSTEKEGITDPLNAETKLVRGSIDAMAGIQNPSRLASSDGGAADPVTKYTSTSIASIDGGSRVFAAWGNDEGSVIGYAYSLSSSSTGKRFELAASTSAGEVPQDGLPVVRAHPGRGFAVAWWHAGAAKIFGALFDDDANRDGSFSFDVSRDSASESLDIGLAPHTNGRWLVVHPSYAVSSAPLEATPISSGGTAQDDQSVTLVGSGENLAPSARSVDLDDDGTLDRLVVAWQRGSNPADPAIHGGWSELGKLNSFDDHAFSIKSTKEFNTGTSIAKGASASAAAWRKEDGNENVEFSPLSLDGPPICPSD